VYINNIVYCSQTHLPQTSCQLPACHKIGPAQPFQVRAYCGPQGPLPQQQKTPAKNGKGYIYRLGSMYVKNVGLHILQAGI
jgi:hypothetical protein